MADNKEKKALRTPTTPSDAPGKAPVLVFSHQLRRDIETACRQLDNHEGQYNLTIIKEAKEWLNK